MGGWLWGSSQLCGVPFTAPWRPPPNKVNGAVRPAPLNREKSGKRARCLQLQTQKGATHLSFGPPVAALSSSFGNRLAKKHRRPISRLHLRTQPPRSPPQFKLVRFPNGFSGTIDKSPKPFPMSSFPARKEPDAFLPMFAIVKSNTVSAPMPSNFQAGAGYAHQPVRRRFLDHGTAAGPRAHRRSEQCPRYSCM